MELGLGWGWGRNLVGGSLVRGSFVERDLTNGSRVQWNVVRRKLIRRNKGRSIVW